MVYFGKNEIFLCLFFLCKKDEFKQISVFFFLFLKHKKIMQIEDEKLIIKTGIFSRQFDYFVKILLPLRYFVEPSSIINFFFFFSFLFFFYNTKCPFEEIRKKWLKNCKEKKFSGKLCYTNLTVSCELSLKTHKPPFDFTRFHFVYAFFLILNFIIVCLIYVLRFEFSCLICFKFAEGNNNQYNKFLISISSFLISLLFSCVVFFIFFTIQQQYHHFIVQ